MSESATYRSPLQAGLSSGFLFSTHSKLRAISTGPRIMAKGHRRVSGWGPKLSIGDLKRAGLSRRFSEGPLKGVVFSAAHSGEGQ